MLNRIYVHLTCISKSVKSKSKMEFTLEKKIYLLLFEQSLYVKMTYISFLGLKGLVLSS